MPFLVVAAAVTATACQQRSPVVAAALALVAWASTKRFEASAARALVVIVLLTVGATWRADGAHQALVPDALGPFQG